MNFSNCGNDSGEEMCHMLASSTEHGAPGGLTVVKIIGPDGKQHRKPKDRLESDESVDSAPNIVTTRRRGKPRWTSEDYRLRGIETATSTPMYIE